MTDTPAPHPLILHPDLFAEDPRAPQTQFVPERQVAFLEALAVSGSVRSAARRAQVSHQTCYRARRGSAAFGRAWDAALVIARGAAEAHLADYAMHGVEEEVWYHGEHVGTRRRVSDRLLLAHLARLDRMRSDARIEALAEDFDAMLLRMRRGQPIELDPIEVAPDPLVEPVAPGPVAEAPGFSSPGPCNTRSMSRHTEPPCDCVGARHGADGGQRHYTMTARGLEPVCNLAGEGPCCDRPRWPDCEDCVHYPPEARLLDAMADERPADAPSLAELGGSREEIERCQMAAFEARDEDWWRYGAGWVLYTRAAGGGWVPEEEIAQGAKPAADAGRGGG